jgi:hypothetical protein
MDAVYLKIREIARQIVAGYPQPDFYSAHPSEFKGSKQFYQSDTSIVRLRKDMAKCLDDDFGHGMGHVEKVAIDAGTLVIIESRLAGQTENRVQRNLLLAQCAGLLHDICRKEKSHAEKGAETARDVLRSYPLVPEEIIHVCTAIRNHEAFARLERLPAHQARMISDCLYDADKFRWGPDNFYHTIWDMVGFLNPPLDVFVDHFPKGMALLKKIRGTFRSRTGRRYGPQFIDMGIAIGEKLYQVILTDFVSQP